MPVSLLNLPRLALVPILVIGLCVLTGCEKEDTNQDSTPVTKFSQLDPSSRKPTDIDKKKKGKEADLSDEAIRNKALEAIKKNQENTIKALERANKEGNVEGKKPSKKDRDPRTTPQTFVKGDTPMVEVPKKLEKGQTSLSIPQTNTKNSRLAEVLGPNHKESVAQGNSVNITNPNAKRDNKDNAATDTRIMSGTGSTDIGDAYSKKDEKPGMLDRLFGKKEKPDSSVRQAESGSQIAILNPGAKTKKVEHVFNEKSDGGTFSPIAPRTKADANQKYNPLGRNEAPNVNAFKPSSPEKHGLLSSMVAAEMAQGALANQITKKERDAEKNSDAVVVPLDGNAKKRAVTDFETVPTKPGAATSTPAAANTTVSPPVPPTTVTNFSGAGLISNQPAAQTTNTTPNIPPAASEKMDAAKNEIQRQFGSVEDYQRGLKSRDIVARERAFQRAVVEKRDDAIPALVEEVARVGLLCEYAARCLATIGKRSDAIDNALIAGLLTTSNKDINLREACAVALGQLRVQRAVPHLIEKCKRDANFPVRSACVAALGMIGDRAAISTLHMKLDDRGEIEFVKQSAALALARFGDSAGREHLINALDSQSPAMQVLGVTGLAQLNDPDTAGLLISRLNSDLEEVWTSVMQLLPRLGAPMAVPMLRNQLLSGNDSMRLRAGLALGYFGNADGIAFICRAARSGSLQERVMGCELIASLQRTDQAQILIERLGDPHSDVRQVAAVALTRMNVAAAAPAIAEAARGRLHNQQLPPALRGAPSDMNERVVMLACLRILRGEKEDLALYTLPNKRDQSWPEFERELLKQQIEMIKLYKLIDVIPSNGNMSGALIQMPGGQETMYREGEVIAAGFKLVDINLGGKNKETGAEVPPYATLQRGNETLTLFVGQNPETSVEK